MTDSSELRRFSKQTRQQLREFVEQNKGALNKLMVQMDALDARIAKMEETIAPEKPQMAVAT